MMSSIAFLTVYFLQAASQGPPVAEHGLRFDTPVTDDPANPMGLDCIVYGNVSFAGGDPTVKWQEPALIEISEDVNGNGLADDPWYLIPGSKDYRYDPSPNRFEPSGETNPNLLDADPANDDDEYYWGYAELTPTMKQYLDNYVRPDDPHRIGVIARSGGGDAFDIAWAVDAAGAPAGLGQFHFIRLRAFIDRECGALGYATPEIDAVADVAPDVDHDGDGILDEYEVRVAGTDPERPESTLLALEIPADEGGSPEGTFLGAAEDAQGNRLELQDLFQVVVDHVIRRRASMPVLKPHHMLLRLIPGQHQNATWFAPLA